MPSSWRATRPRRRELIIAVGGDGTVSEVANGLVEAGADHSLRAGGGRPRVRLRLHPHVRIPKNTEKALDVVRNGTARRIDVGRIEFTGHDGAPGERYFANIASAGMTGSPPTGSTARANRWERRWRSRGLGVDVRRLPQLALRRRDRRRADGAGSNNVIVANCRTSPAA